MFKKDYPSVIVINDCVCLHEYNQLRQARIGAAVEHNDALSIPNSAFGGIAVNSKAASDYVKYHVIYVGARSMSTPLLNYYRRTRTASLNA